jgi:hypothetical protein
MTGPQDPAAAGHDRLRAAVKSGSCLLVAAAAVWAHPLVDPGAGSTPYTFLAPWMLLLTLFSVVAAFGIMGHGVATSWELRRSRRQLPPGPPGHAL